RLVIGGGGGVVVREVVAEQLLHRREVVRGLRGVARSLSLHRLLGGDGSTAVLSGGGACSDEPQYREHCERSQGSVCHSALLSLALGTTRSNRRSSGKFGGGALHPERLSVVSAGLQRGEWQRRRQGFGSSAAPTWLLPRGTPARIGPFRRGASCQEVSTFRVSSPLAGDRSSDSRWRARHKSRRPGAARVRCRDVAGAAPPGRSRPRWVRCSRARSPDRAGSRDAAPPAPRSSSGGRRE